MSFATLSGPYNPLTCSGCNNGTAAPAALAISAATMLPLPHPYPRPAPPTSAFVGAASPSPEDRSNSLVDWIAPRMAARPLAYERRANAARLTTRICLLVRGADSSDNEKLGKGETGWDGRSTQASQDETIGRCYRCVQRCGRSIVDCRKKCVACDADKGKLTSSTNRTESNGIERNRV